MAIQPLKPKNSLLSTGSAGCATCCTASCLRLTVVGSITKIISLNLLSSLFDCRVYLCLNVVINFIRISRSTSKIVWHSLGALDVLCILFALENCISVSTKTKPRKTGSSEVTLLVDEAYIPLSAMKIKTFYTTGFFYYSDY